MAISLKELSEKVTKHGFYSPNYAKRVSLGNGTSLKYTVTENGFIGSSYYTSRDAFVKVFVNGALVFQTPTNGANTYYTNMNFMTPVKRGDIVQMTGANANNMWNIELMYFIPAILTIYYIVRYNIYKLVRFLSHLNTKFGGERR